MNCMQLAYKQSMMKAVTNAPSRCRAFLRRSGWLLQQLCHLELEHNLLQIDVHLLYAPAALLDGPHRQSGLAHMYHSHLMHKLGHLTTPMLGVALPDLNLSWVLALAPKLVRLAL